MEEQVLVVVVEVMESECYQITDEDGNPITDDEGKPWEGESSEWVKIYGRIQVWRCGNWFMFAYFWIFLYGF